MKLVFYSIILNNHQANVADELWELTHHSYCFVELVKPNDSNKKAVSTTMEADRICCAHGSRLKIIGKLWR